jgi:hypothetical protein
LESQKVFAQFTDAMDRCDYRELMETCHLEHDDFVLFDIFNEGVLEQSQEGLVAA